MSRIRLLALTTLTLSLTGGIAAAADSTAPAQALVPAAVASPGPNVERADLATLEREFIQRLEKLEDLRVDAALAGNFDSIRKIDTLLDELIAAHQTEVTALRAARRQQRRTSQDQQNPQQRPAFRPSQQTAQQTAQTRATQSRATQSRATQTRTSQSQGKPAPSDPNQIQLSRDVTRRDAKPVTRQSEAGELSNTNDEQPTVRRVATQIDQTAFWTDGALSLVPSAEAPTSGRRRVVTRTIPAPGLGIAQPDSGVQNPTPFNAAPAERQGRRRATPAPRPAPGLNFDARFDALQRQLKRELNGGA